MRGRGQGWEPSTSSISDPLSTRLLPQGTIEGSEWNVTGLPRDLEHEAIRKPHLGVCAENRQSRGHDIRLLKHQHFVIEEGLDRRGQLSMRDQINRFQNPHTLDKDYMRHPRP